MAEFEISRKAYVKPLLHAAKHPHCSVNGLLLAESQKNKDVKSVKIVDAIPLFHSSLTLAPMLEVALTMIDAYCQTSGLVIVGYYHANENLKDSNPSVIACRIADKIRENCADSCLLMVDNEKAFREPESAFQLYTSSDGKWKKSDKRLTFEADDADILTSLIQSHVHRDIIDFDNHLDNILLDWRNTDVDEQILRCT